MIHAFAVAAAQTIPVAGDVDANVEEHVRLVAAASERGARLLVFPELSVTGYELDRAQELAFSERDPRLAPLIAASAAHAVTLVVGAPVRIAAKLHIGAFVIAPDGDVDVYTKHRLGAFSSGASPDGVVPPAEETVFAAGDRNPLIRIEGDAAAVAVCADVGEPTHAESAAARGAGLYLASMFVIPSDLEAETTRLRESAVRHSMTVVFANFGGASGGLPSGGCSAIWSPHGETLAQFRAAGSGVAVGAHVAGSSRRS